MRTLSIRGEVWANLEEAYEWYAERSLISAEHFRKAVDRCLSRISVAPGECGPYGRSRMLRRCVVGRFPYVVIFEMLDVETIVYTLRHTKRRRYRKPRG